MSSSDFLNNIFILGLLSQKEESINELLWELIKELLKSELKGNFSFSYISSLKLFSNFSCSFKLEGVFKGFLWLWNRRQLAGGWRRS